MKIIQTVNGDLVWQNYDIPTNDEIIAYIENLEDELAEAVSDRESCKEDYDNLLADNDKDIPNNSLTKLQKTLTAMQHKYIEVSTELRSAKEEIESLRKKQIKASDNFPIIFFT